MYVYILDYSTGRCTITQIPDQIDPEQYVSDMFGLDNVEYMTSHKLDLKITNIEN
jgi:hypothetical protein